MTDELFEIAQRVLPELGLVDKVEEHPWNCIHSELDFGGYRLVAWARHWSGVYVQIDAGGNILTVAVANGEDVLREAVTKAKEFMQFMERINAAEVVTA